MRPLLKATEKVRELYGENRPENELIERISFWNEDKRHYCF